MTPGRFTRRQLLRLLPAAALTGCGDDRTSGGPKFPKVPWRITSTTPVAAAMVRQIGGEAVESLCFVPQDSTPYAFAPTAVDLRKFHTSDMVITHGLDFEKRWPEDFDALTKEEDGVRVFCATATIPPDRILRPAGPAGPPDPHVWTDADLSIMMVDAIEAALKEVMPKLADYFAPRAHRLRVDYRDGKAFIASNMNELAPADRFLLTSHDTMQYFARSFGLEARALTTADGTVPESLPAELKDWIAARKVTSLFREPFTDAIALRKLLKDAKVNPDHVIHTLDLPPAGTMGTVVLKQYDLNDSAGVWRYNADTVQSILQVD